MPGTPWTKQEQRTLRAQIKKGKRADEIEIVGRTEGGIDYQIYRLGIHFILWKKSEIEILQKSIMEGLCPKEINIPGRTEISIRNKAIRIGLWKTKVKKIKPWTMKEVAFLKHLVYLGYSSNRVVSNGHFPDRTKDSIAQQMRRQKKKKPKKAE